MTYYVSAYDTEAIYPWWEIGDKPYSASTYQQMVSYEGARLDECLDGVRAVAEVHLRHQAPATFFIVAQLAVAAGSRLREILDHELFDLESHSYTHDNMIAIRDDAAAVRRELVDSKRVIEDLFGREVIGFTAPGGFGHGFLGETRLLEALWEAGYRYVRTLSWQPNHVAPAPLTQPFWFSDDGYPELLEISAHAWHDNILTGQPSPMAWPPALPWGYPSRLPTTGREVYEAYAPGIEYARDQGLLTYAPCFHPWSIYRVDRGAGQIDLLLQHARRAGLTLASCNDVYRHLVADPQLAHPAPKLPTAASA